MQHYHLSENQNISLLIRKKNTKGKTTNFKRTRTLGKIKDAMENGNFSRCVSRKQANSINENKQTYSFVLNNIFLLVPIFLQFIDTFLYARKIEPLQEYSFCK